MTALGDWLDLKDRTRDTLEPNPEKDVGLYVDLDSVIDSAMQRFAVKAPKLVVIGDYGTGKTHLLHVLMDKIDHDRFEPVYVKLDAYGRSAESRHLHDAILTRLEARGLLSVAIAGAVGPDIDTDVAHAFEILRRDPKSPDARAWLLGRGPTPTVARKAGFSTRLSDVARGVTYSGIWKTLGDGFQRSTNKQLFLFIDETETFQEIVDPNRASDLGVAVREMFDAANKSFGTVMGLTAPKARGGQLSAHPLGRPDVLSRVQNSMIRIAGLSTPER